MPRRFTREQGYQPGDLIHFGNDHLVAAMRLFERDDPQVLDSAGYLSHLGIELVLKAFLLHEQGWFPDEHNLLALRSQVEGLGLRLDLSEPDSEALRTLDEFFRLRYPAPHGVPEIGHLHWPIIEHLFQSIASAMPSELNHLLGEIDHTAKGGRQLLARPKGESAA